MFYDLADNFDRLTDFVQDPSDRNIRIAPDGSFLLKKKAASPEEWDRIFTATTHLFTNLPNIDNEVVTEIKNWLSTMHLKCKNDLFPHAAPQSSDPVASVSQWGAGFQKALMNKRATEFVDSINAIGESRNSAWKVELIFDDLCNNMVINSHGEFKDAEVKLKSLIAEMSLLKFPESSAQLRDIASLLELESNEELPETFHETFALPQMNDHEYPSMAHVAKYLMELIADDPKQISEMIRFSDDAGFGLLVTSSILDSTREAVLNAESIGDLVEAFQLRWDLITTANQNALRMEMVYTEEALDYYSKTLFSEPFVYQEDEHGFSHLERPEGLRTIRLEEAAPNRNLARFLSIRHKQDESFIQWCVETNQFAVLHQLEEEWYR
ncbi:MAG: hypothetical protein Q8K75_11910 [Chlamydiales bacterium]|nr:hypothetical protein [Chlamydiales bacterium]